jgi:hypothetical protein
MRRNIRKEACFKIKVLKSIIFQVPNPGLEIAARVRAVHRNKLKGQNQEELATPIC